jgi:tol-pal system protein YbgF
MSIRPICRFRPPLIGLTLAASTILAVGAQGKEADSHSKEIAQFQDRILALRQQAAVDGVALDRLRQEVARLREELSAAKQASGRGVREPDVVRSIVRNDPAIESSELDPAVVPVARPGATSADSPSTTPSTTSSGAAVGEDLQSVYDDGYTLFHQKRYQDAEARFDTFLERGGQSDLADNAQFWIGECRYARGDYAAALSAFTEVVERFPKGNKVPDAMLKAAKTLEAIGDPEAARATYREVESRFPGTAASAIAAERLLALR